MNEQIDNDTPPSVYWFFVTDCLAGETRERERKAGRCEKGKQQTTLRMLRTKAAYHNVIVKVSLEKDCDTNERKI